MFRSFFGRNRGEAVTRPTGELDKFSLAHLQDLHTSLTKLRAMPPTLANDEAIIEAVKQFSEILVVGDKTGSAAGEAVFEFFCEKAVLRTLVLIFRERSSGIKVQIIQTLSILLMNMSNQRSLFYLLSNNHVNDLIASRIDPTDEELLAYYVSFLKTLSLSVTVDTVQFFFAAGPSASALLASDYALVAQLKRQRHHASFTYGSGGGGRGSGGNSGSNRVIVWGRSKSSGGGGTLEHAASAGTYPSTATGSGVGAAGARTPPRGGAASALSAHGPAAAPLAADNAGAMILRSGQESADGTSHTSAGAMMRIPPDGFIDAHSLVDITHTTAAAGIGSSGSNTAGAGGTASGGVLSAPHTPRHTTPRSPFVPTAASTAVIGTPRRTQTQQQAVAGSLTPRQAAAAAAALAPVIVSPEEAAAMTANASAAAASSFASATFPLYSETIRFVHHSDSMVRTAARTIALNIFNVADTGVRAFVTLGPQASFPLQLVAQLRATVLRLNSTIHSMRVLALGNASSSPPPAQQQWSARSITTGNVLAHSSSSGSSGSSSASASSSGSAGIRSSPQFSSLTSGGPSSPALAFISPAAAGGPMASPSILTSGGGGGGGGTDTLLRELGRQLKEQMSELVTFLMFLQDILAVAQREAAVADAAAVAAAAASEAAPRSARATRYSTRKCCMHCEGPIGSTSQQQQQLYCIHCVGEGSFSDPANSVPPQQQRFSDLNENTHASSSSNGGGGGGGVVIAVPSPRGSVVSAGSTSAANSSRSLNYGGGDSDSAQPSFSHLHSFSSSSSSASGTTAAARGAVLSNGSTRATAVAANDGDRGAARRHSRAAPVSDAAAAEAAVAFTTPSLAALLACRSMNVTHVPTSSSSNGGGAFDDYAAESPPPSAASFYIDCTFARFATRLAAGLMRCVVLPLLLHTLTCAAYPPSIVVPPIAATSTSTSRTPHAHANRSHGRTAAPATSTSAAAQSAATSTSSLRPGVEHSSSESLQSGISNDAAAAYPSSPSAAVSSGALRLARLSIEPAGDDAAAAKEDEHNPFASPPPGATSTSSFASPAGGVRRTASTSTRRHVSEAASAGSAASARHQLPMPTSTTERQQPSSHSRSSSSTRDVDAYYASAALPPLDIPSPTWSSPLGIGPRPTSTWSSPFAAAGIEPRLPSAYTSEKVIDPALALVITGHFIRVLTYPPLALAMSELLLESQLPLPSPVLGECTEAQLVGALSASAAASAGGAAVTQSTAKRKAWWREAATSLSAAAAAGAPISAASTSSTGATSAEEGTAAPASRSGSEALHAVVAPTHSTPDVVAAAASAPFRLRRSQRTLRDVLVAMLSSPEHRLVGLSAGLMHAISSVWTSADAALISTAMSGSPTAAAPSRAPSSSSAAACSPTSTYISGGGSCGRGYFFACVRTLTRRVIAAGLAPRRTVLAAAASSRRRIIAQAIARATRALPHGTHPAATAVAAAGESGNSYEMSDSRHRSTVTALGMMGSTDDDGSGATTAAAAAAAAAMGARTSTSIGATGAAALGSTTSPTSTFSYRPTAVTLVGDVGADGLASPLLPRDDDAEQDHRRYYYAAARSTAAAAAPGSAGTNASSYNDDAGVEAPRLSSSRGRERAHTAAADHFITSPGGVRGRSHPTATTAAAAPFRPSNVVEVDSPDRPASSSSSSVVGHVLDSDDTSAPSVTISSPKRPPPPHEQVFWERYDDAAAAAAASVAAAVSSPSSSRVADGDSRGLHIDSRGAERESSSAGSGSGGSSSTGVAGSRASYTSSSTGGGAQSPPMPLPGGIRAWRLLTASASTSSFYGSPAVTAATPSQSASPAHTAAAAAAPLSASSSSATGVAGIAAALAAASSSPLCASADSARLQNTAESSPISAPHTHPSGGSDLLEAVLLLQSPRRLLRHGGGGPSARSPAGSQQRRRRDGGTLCGGTAGAADAGATAADGFFDTYSYVGDADDDPRNFNLVHSLASADAALLRDNALLDSVLISIVQHALTRLPSLPPSAFRGVVDLLLHLCVCAHAAPASSRTGGSSSNSSSGGGIIGYSSSSSATNSSSSNSSEGGNITFTNSTIRPHSFSSAAAAVSSYLPLLPIPATACLLSSIRALGAAIASRVETCRARDPANSLSPLLHMLETAAEAEATGSEMAGLAVAAVMRATATSTWDAGVMRGATSTCAVTPSSAASAWERETEEWEDEEAQQKLKLDAEAQAQTQQIYGPNGTLVRTPSSSAIVYAPHGTLTFDEGDASASLRGQQLQLASGASSGSVRIEAARFQLPIAAAAAAANGSAAATVTASYVGAGRASTAPATSNAASLVRESQQQRVREAEQLQQQQQRAAAQSAHCSRRIALIKQARETCLTALAPPAVAAAPPQGPGASSTITFGGGGGGGASSAALFAVLDNVSVLAPWSVCSNNSTSNSSGNNAPHRDAPLLLRSNSGGGGGGHFTFNRSASSTVAADSGYAVESSGGGRRMCTDVGAYAPAVDVVRFYFPTATATSAASADSAAAATATPFAHSSTVSSGLNATTPPVSFPNMPSSVPSPTSLTATPPAHCPEPYFSDMVGLLVRLRGLVATVSNAAALNTIVQVAMLPLRAPYTLAAAGSVQPVAAAASYAAAALFSVSGSAPASLPSAVELPDYALLERASELLQLSKAAAAASVVNAAGSSRKVSSAGTTTPVSSGQSPASAVAQTAMQQLQPPVSSFSNNSSAFPLTAAAPPHPVVLSSASSYSAAMSAATGASAAERDMSAPLKSEAPATTSAAAALTAPATATTTRNSSFDGASPSPLVPRYTSPSSPGLSIRWDGASLFLDPSLRAIAPPSDSIRPGTAFNMSRLPWFAATAYPTVLQLAAPPVGPGAASGDSRDVLAPIALALGAAVRVGVVLGQSYLVLAEFVVQPATAAPPLVSNSVTTTATTASGGGTTASSSGSAAFLALSSGSSGAGGGMSLRNVVATAGAGAVGGGGDRKGSSSSSSSSSSVALAQDHFARLGAAYAAAAATPSTASSGTGAMIAPTTAAKDTVVSLPPPTPTQRARALTVLPLHFTYTTQPSRAPHVVDVRALSRVHVPLTRTVATLLEEAGPLEVAGLTLVLDNGDLASHTVSHIEAARRRILDAKLLAVRRLGVPPGPC